MSDINSATNGLPILKNSAIPNPSPTIHVTGVTLNKTTASLAVNGTEQLTATVQPTNATNRSVTWSSSNTSIATVNTSGLVTAFAAGTATITATTADGGKTATCTVTVTEPTISVTGVTLKTATSLIVNGTEQLTATVQPTNATNKTVTWSSNNTSVATVSTSGLITALAVGTATITATTADGGKTATCTVTVAAATISVTSVTLDKTTATLTINGMEQLTATVQPTTATNQQVTWSSSNTSIATVSTSGLVTAKAVGTVTITVTTTDGGKTATCEVTVTSIASGESWNIGYPIETDVIATLSADGTTLTISGTGAMVNYNVYEAPPWYDMSSIKTVVINEGVTSIGNYAFSICNSLTSVTIPNSVTSIGDYAFGWCIGLTSVTIPNSVTSIGKDAFYRCSGLTSVTIPNSVTSIGDYAFSYCSGLTSVTIGNSVTSIGEAAFRDCIGLTSVTIPNSVTSIGKDAFYYCSGLTSVTIPNSVTSIGGAAFWYCSNLTSVTISGTGAMANYTSESSPWTFVSIKTVVINEGVTSIGNYAFSICSSLTSVTIPESVTSIGDYAFADCSGLTSVTIPNSVTSIGDYAFGRCIGLTSVTIPNSVTSIGDYAFQNCDGLTSVTCLATTPPTQGNDSFYTFNIVTLYVPASALDTYRNNSSWRSEFNIILAIESTIVPAMSVSLDKNSAALSVGDTEQLTASILPTNATNQQVTWNSSNTSVATVSENGLVTALAAGTASITVTTADGSFTATCKVTVAASGTAIETTEADKLAVYPNPARDDLFIKSDTPIEKVEIFDISGRAVETWRAASLQQGNLQTIHVSHLPNGIYLVRVACSDGSAVTKKIVVKK
ncbi:hypothetical protein AGMMS4957_10830 [Bacteroidia bacterium]|nr:hypothetical protein AGMMS4957_10830 [Bacteroidia bacterium]